MIFSVQMPEVIFQGNGTDEVFHVLVDPRQNYVQRWASLQVGYVFSIDQITIKTPHPKCRLYWRLIELDIKSVMLLFSTPLVN